LNDLAGDKNDKKEQNKHNDTFNVDNSKDYGDIEDDLALILNDKQPKQISKAIESNDNDDDDDDHHQQTK
jgi:hypothetical protein